MVKTTFESIFDVISDDPSETSVLQFKADLILVIRDLLEPDGWSEEHIVEALGIPISKAYDLLSGRIDPFSAGALIGYLAKLGYQFKPVYVPSTGQIQCSTQKIKP